MAQQVDKSLQIHAHGQGPERDTLITAAVLLSEDTLTDEQIAQHLKISRRTLARWKTRPDMCFALDCLYRLNSRTLHRHFGRWWNETELGPKTVNAWEP